MTAAATTLSTASPGNPPKVSAWENLRTLLPYIWRYKVGTILGIATLLLGGLVGAMLPLVMGTIVDSLSGSHSLIERMQALPGPVERFLMSFYRPLSSETL